jgi:hypothetical protein
MLQNSRKMLGIGMRKQTVQCGFRLDAKHQYDKFGVLGYKGMTLVSWWKIILENEGSLKSTGLLAARSS